MTSLTTESINCVQTLFKLLVYNNIWVLCLMPLLLYQGSGAVDNLSISKSAAVEDHLVHVDELKNVAHFGDAQHRGPEWYDDDTSSSSSGESYMLSELSSYSSSLSSSTEETSSSSGASSVETKEERLKKRAYRVCTPCPHDMLKSHKNVGIKWICGAYQRARRTFKSVCMMRYRNCQDGTLFVKIYDHRCKNDTYHGRHWFYVYRA